MIRLSDRQERRHTEAYFLGLCTQGTGLQVQSFYTSFDKTLEPDTVTRQRGAILVSVSGLLLMSFTHINQECLSHQQLCPQASKTTPSMVTPKGRLEENAGIGKPASPSSTPDNPLREPIDPSTLMRSIIRPWCFSERPESRIEVHHDLPVSWSRSLSSLRRIFTVSLDAASSVDCYIQRVGFMAPQGPAGRRH